MLYLIFYGNHKYFNNILRISLSCEFVEETKKTQNQKEKLIFPLPSKGKTVNVL